MTYTPFVVSHSTSPAKNVSFGSYSFKGLESPLSEAIDCFTMKQLRQGDPPRIAATSPEMDISFSLSDYLDTLGSWSRFNGS